MWRRLQPHVTEAATACDGGCDRMWRRLRPHVAEAAAACGGGCSRMWRRLRPHVAEAAAASDGGCSRMWRRLQPHVAEAAAARDEGCHSMQVFKLVADTKSTNTFVALTLLVALGMGIAAEERDPKTCPTTPHRLPISPNTS